MHDAASAFHLFSSSATKKPEPEHDVRACSRVVLPRFDQLGPGLLATAKPLRRSASVKIGPCVSVVVSCVFRSSLGDVALLLRPGPNRPLAKSMSSFLRQSMLSPYDACCFLLQHSIVRPPSLNLSIDPKTQAIRAINQASQPMLSERAPFD